MKTITFVSCLAVLLAAAPAAAAPAAVIEAHGTATYLPPGGSRRPIAGLPLALDGSGEVRTSGGAGLTIRFSDDSEVRLGPNSVFRLREESPALISLLLNLGKAWAVVSKNPRRAFEIRTPTAICAVRGTRFSVEAGDAWTVTEVEEGRVAVSVLKAGISVGEPSLLGAGQRVQIRDGALVPPTSAPERGKLGANSPADPAFLGREVGLQLQQDALHSALGQSGANSAISPASVRLQMGALSQQGGGQSGAGAAGVAPGAAQALTVLQPLSGNPCTVTCVLGICTCN